MKQYPLDHISDITALIPAVVAETVLNQNNLNRQEHEWFVLHVEERFVYLFNNNIQWRRNMKRCNARETFYAFVNHWFKAYMIDNELYEQRHSPGSKSTRQKLNCTLDSKGASNE